MSDSSNSDKNAASAGPHDGSDDQHNKLLAHVESPGIAPGSPDTIKADAAKAEAVLPEPAASRDGGARAHPYGTALILAPQRARAEAPEPKVEPAPATSPSRFRLGARAAMVAAAAAVGGLAGSLATAGVSYLTASEQATPSHYAALAQALGRVDHELTALKTAAESYTRAAALHVAKIADRLDRAEKAQADSGAKIAKATDTIDRMERRLAAVSSDVTGTTGEPHVAVAAVAPPTPEMRRLSPGPIVDGWVVRDVYNGAALIQGRAGIIQVVPGDNLPGLGRIEQVRRQDGHWVVVTSRGLIVPR
jgi:hypothetical protein